MRILLAYIHYPVCSGRYIKRAFAALGHDVRSVGPSTGDYLPYTSVEYKHIHTSDGALDAHWDDWQPDLVVVCDSAWAYRHPVYADVPHVVWGVDNHVKDYTSPYVDHYFLAHKATSVMDMHRDDVTWLPCAYDDGYFYPDGATDYDKRAYDVVLIGVPYEARAKAMAALDKAGYKTLIGYAFFDTFRELHHNARIALNISAKGDLNQRIFETAALGCHVLTQPVDDAGELGISLNTFESQKDMLKQVAKLLKTKPDNKWIDKGHTWRDRAQVIIDWMSAKGKANADE